MSTLVKIYSSCFHLVLRTNFWSQCRVQFSLELSVFCRLLKESSVWEEEEAGLTRCQFFCRMPPHFSELPALACWAATTWLIIYHGVFSTPWRPALIIRVIAPLTLFKLPSGGCFWNSCCVRLSASLSLWIHTYNSSNTPHRNIHQWTFKSPNECDDDDDDGDVICRLVFGGW